MAAAAVSAQQTSSMLPVKISFGTMGIMAAGPRDLVYGFSPHQRAAGGCARSLLGT
jgi:hypothetical protein